MWIEMRLLFALLLKNENLWTITSQFTTVITFCNNIIRNRRYRRRLLYLDSQKNVPFCENITQPLLFALCWLWSNLWQRDTAWNTYSNALCKHWQQLFLIPYSERPTKSTFSHVNYFYLNYTSRFWYWFPCFGCCFWGQPTSHLVKTSKPTSLAEILWTSWSDLLPLQFRGVG